MDLAKLLAQRRMTRSFDGSEVDPAWLEERCAEALWAPTAGNSAGVRMHVIAQNDVASYFHYATDEGWRSGARRAPGLMRAGAVVLVTAQPALYLERYAESDKGDSSLTQLESWPLPYWHTDAAMATMALLLLLEEAGLAATIWGSFRHEADVLGWARVLDEQLFASVLIGRDDGNDVASASLQRDVPTRRARVSRVTPTN
ncbi:MAG TPA: nitroreductase family protein [Acidimicrobiales bacterium]|nr:nitroreductase family protein [Acidimicrobiales bacterium]